MSKKNIPKENSYLATECDKVGEIAIHYGFTVIQPPHINLADITESKQFKNFDTNENAYEKISLTRWYMETLQNINQPIMIHFQKPLPGNPIKKKPLQEMYGLEIMQSNKPESEALILKSTLAILSDIGYKNVCVDVNSIGDKESVSKFEKEIAVYFRKHGNDLSKKCKEEFKKNWYEFLTQVTPETETFCQNCPQILGTLSELSRSHFKEVLEYMEIFGITYKMKPNLFSNKLYGAHTVFEIRNMDTENTLLACGYRYNYLAKKIGSKKEIPCIGMTIYAKKTDIPAKTFIIKNIKKPRFYLVQLGETAKLKALNVVEMLRLERIPVYHSLTKDKITAQLSGAEYVHATHVLIIGQKEAIENSIVVRHVVTREQETVFLTDLPGFLRALL